MTIYCGKAKDAYVCRTGQLKIYPYSFLLSETSIFVATMSTWAEYTVLDDFIYVPTYVRSA